MNALDQCPDRWRLTRVQSIDTFRSMKPKPLLEATYDLLAQARGEITLEAIADGADVGLSWLRKFSAKSIPKPGVLPVQRVHDFLHERLRADAA